MKSEDKFSDVLTKNVSVGIFERLGAALINGFEGHDKMFTFANSEGE